MKFKNLEIADIPILQTFFDCQSSRMSDFTAGSFFEWAEYLKTQYAICDGTLFVRFFDRAHDHYIYAYIATEGNDFAAIDKIEKIIDGKHAVTLAAIAEENLPQLESHYKIRYHYERIWSDYLYDAAEFREFSGKKFHSKRNHISRFIREYGEYSYEWINDENLGEALELLDDYTKNGDENELFEYELRKSREVLNNLAVLGLSGGMIRVGGRAVGIAVGSIVGDTLFVHIEKALREYIGAYTVIANEFARRFPNVLYINREDDTGDEGLRKSKLSYNPIKLIHKYVVYIDGKK